MTICAAVIEFLLPGRGSERNGEANTQISLEKTQKTDTNQIVTRQNICFSVCLAWF